MASLTPTFFTMGLSYFTDLPACVYLWRACVCASVRKGPFSPLYFVVSPSVFHSPSCTLTLSLSLALCLSVLLWVIYMQQCILGSYRRVCSHGFCGVVWLVRHMEAGSWVHVIIYI